MIYREWDGIATAQLYWSCPLMSKRIIPQCRLFSDTGEIVTTVPHSYGKATVLSPSSIGRMRVYDLAGRLIKQIDASNMSDYIRSGRLSRGVFIIRTQKASGGTSVTSPSMRAVVVE